MLILAGKRYLLLLAMHTRHYSWYMASYIVTSNRQSAVGYGSLTSSCCADWPAQKLAAKVWQPVKGGASAVDPELLLTNIGCLVRVQVPAVCDSRALHHVCWGAIADGPTPGVLWSSQ
jgi:hypothetical protein